MKININVIPTVQEALCLVKTVKKTGPKVMSKPMGKPMPMSKREFDKKLNEIPSNEELWKRLYPIVNKRWLSLEDFKISNVAKDYAMFTYDKEKGGQFYVDQSSSLSFGMYRLITYLSEITTDTRLAELFDKKELADEIYKETKANKFYLLAPIMPANLKHFFNKFEVFHKTFKAQVVFALFKKKLYPILVDKRWVKLPEPTNQVEKQSIQKVETVSMQIPDKDEVKELVKVDFYERKDITVKKSPLIDFVIAKKIFKPPKSGSYYVDAVRKACKEHINKEIAKKLGKGTDAQVKQFIDGWAHSSFSNASCLVQMAAANKFGVPISDYVKTVFEENGVEIDPNKTSPLLEAIYDRTQEFLKEQEIENITLFRGVCLPEKAFNDGVCYKKLIEVNPLNSWSSDIKIAFSFSAEHRNGEFPFILSCKVPAINIVSTPVTGMGCLNELEYIVAGGKYEVLIDPLTYFWLAYANPRLAKSNNNFPKFGMPAGFSNARDELLGNNSIPFQDKQFIITSLEEMFDYYKKNLGHNTTPNEKKLFEAMTPNNVLKHLQTETITHGNIVIAKDQEPLNIDQGQNADWTKQTWDLPPYKSKEFMTFLERAKQTLEQFKQLLVYKKAVRKGRIKNDKWVQ